MIKNQSAECAIIGGSPMERLLYAIKLRRMGVSCDADFRTRKRNKACKWAVENNRWGTGGVYDLDDAEDRAWLDRDDLTKVGV